MNLIINKSTVKSVVRIMYWMLPGLLILLIVHRINLDELRQNLKLINVSFMVFTVMLYPVSILLGALRWHRLLNRFTQMHISLRFTLVQHWIGYAMGLFTPGNSGWDAYRIVRGGQAVQAYRSGFLIIVLERLTSLICAMIILLVGAFFIDGNIHERIPLIISFSGLLLLLSLIGLGLLYWENGRMMQAGIEWIRKVFRRPAQESPPINFVSLRKAMPKKELIILFGFSFAIQFFFVLINFLLFYAIRNPIAFSVVAFSIPASLLVTMVPVSFGSVGIREFTYITLFGFWGVAPEKAVLVAFFNLLGLLINGLTGAALFVTHFRRYSHGFSGRLREHP